MSDYTYYTRNLPCMSSEELMRELHRQEFLASKCIQDNITLDFYVIKSCLYLSLIEPGL